MELIRSNSKQLINNFVIFFCFNILKYGTKLFHFLTFVLNTQFSQEFNNINSFAYSLQNYLRLNLILVSEKITFKIIQNNSSQTNPNIIQ